jgi:hypothetical protein
MADTFRCSGMQEDLRMYGSQYTYAVSFSDSSLCIQFWLPLQGTAYTCAYAVMQVPSTLIIQKIRPSYWLAFIEVGWGVFTFAQAGMRNTNMLYAFRFLVGFFESSFFPCMLYVLGSWWVFLTHPGRQSSNPLPPGTRRQNWVCWNPLSSEIHKLRLTIDPIMQRSVLLSSIWPLLWAQLLVDTSYVYKHPTRWYSLIFRAQASSSI